MKQTIPEQLKGMRFNRVRFKEKRAFEPGWQNKPYTYEEISKYFPANNYGVICGKEVRALDDDTPTEELITLFIKTFGETFRVRGHLYFKFSNGHSKKIIFEKDGTHFGELQGEATYVVGPGCTHPSGELYEQKNDLPIIEVDYNKFEEVFRDLIKKKKKAIQRTSPSVRTTFSGDNISNIPLSSIISFGDLEDVGNNSLQGPHPLHGSDGGMNFRINTADNTWYCFRCQAGGGPSELIAVMEGIIDCGDAGSNCFTTDQGQEVIAVAREKYGLTVPEQDLGEIRGWANSVSIVNLAKKRNFEKCPKCDTAWRFQDSHGLYYCDTCKYGGGLPQFADMIIEERNRKSTAEEALSKL
ncbi:hypothetical protein LCGC14_0441980 [marine sediment metagenome]|uniref:Uncharacterized protein n=1 Tax=marine sediment metagenome TaxID=412755 RepID=A0A0F9SR43_9ZZZZ